MKKPFVIIESPFSAPTMPELIQNIQYALLAVRHSLNQGEAPYASHLFYTQMLDDNNAAERQNGIKAGLEIGSFAQKTAVYTDFGISNGMKYGLDAAKNINREIVERTLFPSTASREEKLQLMLTEYNRHDLPSPEVLASIYGRILK